MEAPAPFAAGVAVALAFALGLFLALFILRPRAVGPELATLLGTGEPKLRAGLAAAWGCCRKWRPSYFRAIGERRGLEVQCSLGVEEESGPTRKATLLLRDFVDRLGGDAPPADRKAGDVAPYLKQLEVAEAFPEEVSAYLPALRQSDAGLRRWGVTVLTYFWFGAQGCTTGLHSDDEDNYIIMCYGAKRVVLFPPETGPNLYTNDKYDSGTVCCDVDVFRPDLERHPRYAHAAPAQRIYDLKAGDVLFIPAFWWHAVLTTSPVAISLNSFVSRPIEMLSRGLWRGLLHYLHEYAGYRRRSCVCHAG